MPTQVFLVDLAPEITLELTPWWDGCTKGGGDGHRTIPFAFHDRPYEKNISQADARAILPPELTCAFCGATIKLVDLPAQQNWGGRLQDPIHMGADRAYTRRDTGERLWDAVPGMAFDSQGWDDELVTGTPLRDTDLVVPLVPDPRVTNADGSIAQPRSMYGWQWVQECKARGVWLPRWHITLPTSVPWRDGYRGDAIFPTCMYANNGADQGNGYTTGWTADQWDDPTKMTLQPSIFFSQGGPGEWHGFLRGGVLTP